MCAFGEFWWVFLVTTFLFYFILVMVPPDNTVGLVSGIICFVSFVLLAVAEGAKYDLGCKEVQYQSVLDRRPELIRECPDREKPGCQLRWIQYQKDSLDRYLHILQR